MALTAEELQQRLEWLSQTLREAGRIVLQYYDNGAEVEWKAPKDPVTDADRASNEFLVAALKKAFPDEAVLAEESHDDLERLAHSRVWMVDPLDGTKEFIARNGEFSVMVGLVEDGRPVLGAVYQPTEDRLYTGGRGVPALLEEGGNRRELHVSDRTDVRRFRLVVSRSHLEPVVEDIRKRLGISDLRQSGSVGLKCGLIARDECDLYIHPSSYARLWDSCAPQAVLEAAGGVMTDIYGRPLVYTREETRNLNGLLASNGKAHEEIVAVVREVLEAARV